MTPKDIASTVYYCTAIVGIVVAVLKGFFGWFRGDQINKKFVTDMAEHHLPYIYKELRHLSPRSVEPPPIAFTNLKDK